MIGFREFLVEVVRDDARALKLALNLGKRRQRTHPVSWDQRRHKETPIKNFNPKDERTVLDHPNTNKVLGREGPYRPKGKPKTLNINSLTPAQHALSLKKGKMKRAIKNKNDPIHVLRGKDGKHRIIDGHHRWFAARLRGHETVQAHVTNEETIKEKR